MKCTILFSMKKKKIKISSAEFFTQHETVKIQETLPWRLAKLCPIVDRIFASGQDLCKHIICQQQLSELVNYRSSCVHCPQVVTD